MFNSGSLITPPSFCGSRYYSGTVWGGLRHSALWELTSNFRNAYGQNRYILCTHTYAGESCSALWSALSTQKYLWRRTEWRSQVCGFMAAPFEVEAYAWVRTLRNSASPFRKFMSIVQCVLKRVENQSENKFRCPPFPPRLPAQNCSYISAAAWVE